MRSVSAVGRVGDAKVYRTHKIPKVETNGITVYAARYNLDSVIGARIRSGTWLNPATGTYPAVVLGATAAERLGIGHAGPDTQVLIGGEWFTVVGIFEPAPLAPEVDSAALIGWPVAESDLGFDGHPTIVYTRSEDAQVEAVSLVLGPTANPEAPNEVQVSRPSDALAAKQAVGEAFTGLLLGQGAVALLVGGVGVANTMVISVLERRAEIGLRRSQGATRGQIRTQFLAESLLLSAVGGAAGACWAPPSAPGTPRTRTGRPSSRPGRCSAESASPSPSAAWPASTPPSTPPASPPRRHWPRPRLAGQGCAHIGRPWPSA